MVLYLFIRSSSDVGYRLTHNLYNFFAPRICVPPKLPLSCDILLNIFPLILIVYDIFLIVLLYSCTAKKNNPDITSTAVPEITVITLIFLSKNT